MSDIYDVLIRFQRGCIDDAVDMRLTSAEAARDFLNDYCRAKLDQIERMEEKQMLTIQPYVNGLPIHDEVGHGRVHIQRLGPVAECGPNTYAIWEEVSGADSAVEFLHTYADGMIVCMAKGLDALVRARLDAKNIAAGEPMWLRTAQERRP